MSVSPQFAETTDTRGLERVKGNDSSSSLPFGCGLRDDSRAALQAAVNEALGTEVLLADDALTGTSLLTIERWPTGTMDNPVPEGRRLDKPIQFELVRNGDDCVLVKKSDGARYPLGNTDCAAE